MFKTFEAVGWTFDVWGNARDGYEVNDRRQVDTVKVRVRGTVHNGGTEHEFTSFAPTDRDCLRIAKRCGILAPHASRRSVEFDGDDTVVYVNARKDGYPLGEFYLESR